jgi:hypothetical protein
VDADAYATGRDLAIVPVTGGEVRSITPFDAFGVGDFAGQATPIVGGTDEKTVPTV